MLNKIKKINIYGLFGCYNYEDINLEEDFVFFYGDNGVGKSTVINIIFEFLTMSFYGEKSKTRGKYEKMQIEFYNNSKFEIEENIFRVYDNGKMVFEEEFADDCSEDMKIILKNINNEILYINDNRKLLNVNKDKKISEKQLKDIVNQIENQFINAYNLSLKESYNDIDEILFESMSYKVQLNNKKKELIYKKKELDKMNEEFSKYGIMSIGDRFKVEMEDITEENMQFVQFYNFYKNNSLSKFKKLYMRINRLVSEINQYLFDKELIFDIINGFRIIHSKTNERIAIEWLSSGEKNLIRILFSCMICNGQARIFLIDEPELSLNMKWLDKIVDSLKNINKEEEVQFIICTHSFDIISQNRNQVYKFKG